MIYVLLFSVLLNLFFLWYVKQILTRLWFVSSNIGSLLDALDEYYECANSIYELEKFYGDQEIKEFVQQTKNMIEELKQYESVYSLTDLDEDFLEVEEVNGEEN